MQNYYQDPQTGGILTCPGIYHSALDYNCSDFTFAIEKWIVRY